MKVNSNEAITVDYKEIEESSIKNKGIEEKYLVDKSLITNSERGNLLNELKKCLSECERFYFSVAFINFSGLQLLLDSFKELEEKGVRGKIITSTYLNFTEPKALKRIKNFSNIDLKIFVASNEKGFHTKAYIFENQDEYKIIIGSSNITQRAVKSNVEWNVKVISKKEDKFSCEVIKEYLELWESTSFVDDEFLNSYNNFIQEIRKTEKKTLEFKNYEIIKPNYMQNRAISNLNRLRLQGEDKALVVAATGTGKTYMSAFDVINYNPKKMLFLVHREDILKGAEATFRKLVKNKNKTTGFLTGTRKDISADYLFSTIQSMNNNLDSFKADEFGYIIIDEAHHASSPAYKNAMNYFKPKFILGMTATPERCDNESIFEVFDENLALEIRLSEALENELIVPFHYFGITDIEGINLENVDINDISELTKRLKVNERVDFIIDKMNFYGYEGEKCKCIGFCVSIEHARYMAEEFNKRGIKSVHLTGKNSPEEREAYIKSLESEDDDLEIIFTVDIFNEGVDIPSINLVLMLRPTNSPIVFIQQLGRGLRKHSDKTFLTVLDFIGNHNKAFLIALALNGGRYYDKDSLKVSVAKQFENIPGCTNIQMDRIAQERILEQLNNENFNSMKYLKEEYLEFKKLNGGKVPYLLLDYIKYDGAPEPLRFVNKEKTYIGFVSRIEKDEELQKLLQNETFYKILKEFSSKLPLKRVYEFSIIKYLIYNEKISLNEAKREILKHINDVDDISIVHALNVLNQGYDDSGQLKNNIRCFNLDNGKLTATEDFKNIINDKKYRVYIEDVINYGIIRYEKEFGEEYYEVPFLKLYEQYQMVDIALLSNYTKTHSSFRGSGLLANGKEYFLFIDLHKEEDIKESINYNDKFIDRETFQWQSPNTTSQESERGKNIIYNRERGVNLHLFVRKYKTIDKIVQPYIYIGKGDVEEFYGEKPITTILKLENKVPHGIYTEFIEKV
ncbi:DEAD/DEAH box helicase [Clostridium botulinum]|uniref:DNA repair helicase n=1 Tax=Clostridium botulinum C/D str. DC5 TaxID=1443128 RepID=A0A0A0IAU8_CLOBO|nr:DEAD/DEAH box helicase [Clostridium botulinum]KGM98067.1 DNA repair helicase [Clostridium botulinum C/D str. DC5]KOC51217.1 DNA repair helicase [Clostridium botulinum]KOC56376.1 DNA repair helicase [Clostridium botulinum]MCD3235317.1 DEAD/DEAH box helicase [Clostridium botulinum D/C]MCD3241222.1 DEAD/DEAH box helicase [Clostridium botulinum D/C]